MPPLNSPSYIWQHLLARPDNTYDIGANGATRPRSIYIGTFALAPAYYVGITQHGIVGASGGVGIQSANVTVVGVYNNQVQGLTLFNGIPLGFSPSAVNNTPDLLLVRDAANTLAQRNGTNPQTLRIYNTYTDASNYERLNIAFTGGAFRIFAQNAGTGVARALSIENAANDLYFYGNRIIFQVTGGLQVWQLSSAGNLLAWTDNTFDIGALGANRPRNIFVGGFFSGKGAVPNGGSQNYALAKNSSTDYDVVWTPVALPTDITNLQNQITTLQNTVTSLQNQIDSLTSRMSTAETNITAINTHNNTQDQAISDLQQRVTALEQGSPAKSGPFIGDLVHVSDAKGHCQPAICYEDWDGKNANGTISVAVLSPIRLSDSPWDSYIEVHEKNGVVEPPFTTWHWPEMAFQYRRELFRKIAEKNYAG